MLRSLFRRDYPDSDLAQRETRREKRLLAIVLGIPVVLFLMFLAYYLFAPWEMAYREHGGAILRAQIEALPPYNTDRLQLLTSVTNHGVSVTAEYSRNELCAPVLDYYRQAAHAHGWTYTRTQSEDMDTIDYYAGVFGGYKSELAIDCNLRAFGYELSATGPDLCLWSCPPQDTQS